MSTMSLVPAESPFRAKFKHPELLAPKRVIVPVKEELFALKLERQPVKVNSASYTAERLVALLNKLESRNEVIKSVEIADWVLGCRMQDDVIGILAKGNKPVDLAHYVWYGRADIWQHALNLDDLVQLLQRKYGHALKTPYLSEKCLQLELNVRIVMLDR
ncbi:hypothetical protein pEaSNUABM37_00067 [Erwinia phage pEa_SNUABM_37]|nr:hypothetical protein pEaSNUABM37_00067 [Erwinia phage pEa_SNUABM_37]QXO10537.1 hypothetical protein pEaSNUABM48_00067 [Erwinia phage pEa_SNUABM_48]